MPIRHRFQSGVADGADATQVRPSNWNESHEFTWRVVTAAETLASGDPLVADLAASATFPMPATITAGQTFALRNSPDSASGVVVSLNPGASRSVIYGAGQSTPIGDTITLERGETISLVALDNTKLELVTPGAVGPVGPAFSGLGGNVTLTVPAGSGVFEHIQTFTTAGVTAASRLDVRLAGTADTEENDPEMLDVASLWGVPGTGQITVGITFSAPTSGPVLINWSAL